MHNKKEINAKYLIDKIIASDKQDRKLINLPKKFIVQGKEYSIKRIPGLGAYFNVEDGLILIGNDSKQDIDQVRNILHEALEVSFEEHLCRMQNVTGEFFFVCNHEQFCLIVNTLAKLILDCININKDSNNKRLLTKKIEYKEEEK
ncbi:MAG: hypothetical protein WC934_08460 [Acidithiobacillus sp.]|uniref:hypothetical protein n=1 Tax=Acidithiobacillus sp. TaxID=1872118 RepID=UPI003560D704